MIAKDVQTKYAMRNTLINYLSIRPTLTDRMQNYKEVTGYPDSVSIACDGRLYGTWVMGQNYTVKSEYYGGYPAGYLRRIKALFPENPETLHVCSGKVDLGAFPGDTLDINPLMNPPLS